MRSSVPGGEWRIIERIIATSLLFLSMTLVIVVHVTPPSSLLQWSVPPAPDNNGGSTYFAAGRKARPMPWASRMPDSMSKVMQETAADRRSRYNAHGYAWHDPTIERKEVEHDVAAAVEPLERSMSEMEHEMEGEQHEIEGLDHSRHKSVSSAENVAPELHFTIPGPISMDHLSLPAGAYALSLGQFSATPAAALVPEASAVAATQLQSDVLDTRKDLHTGIDREMVAKSAHQLMHHYIKHAGVAATALRLEAKLEVLEREQLSDEKPQQSLAHATVHVDALDALADAQLSAAAVPGAAMTQLALLSGERRKTLATKRLRMPSPIKPRQIHAKRLGGESVGPRHKAMLHKASILRKASIFHHVLQHGAPTAGGHQVSRIIAGMVKAETQMTTRERAFAAKALSHVDVDLHAANLHLTQRHKTRRKENKAQDNGLKDQIDRHQIDMQNVGRLQAVRECLVLCCSLSCRCCSVL